MASSTMGFAKGCRVLMAAAKTSAAAASAQKTGAAATRPPTGILKPLPVSPSLGAFLKPLALLLLPSKVSTSAPHLQDFFRKLMDMFRVCEDLENVDGLHVIFKIVRGIILLNSLPIFENIFGDELIMDIIGSLE